MAMEKISYFIIGRFEYGSKYNVISKKQVEGYRIDDIAAVRKVEGRQSDFWITDSFKTGVGIQTVGCKTRKAAVQEYKNNFEQKIRDFLTEDRMQAMEKQLQDAVSEEILQQYEEIDVVTLYDYRLDKITEAAKDRACIIRKVTEETYQNGGHIKIYGTKGMLADAKALIDRYADHDKQKASEQAAPEEQEQETQEEQAVNVAELTEENLQQYMPALLMMLANDKHNSSIIMAAGVDAGVITASQLLEFLQIGRMPAVHTFDIWKDAGYRVKKGQHHAFQARIWKYTEKKAGTYTEAEADTINSMIVNADGSDFVQAGEEKTQRGFIKKLAYFFTADQVEKVELQELPELPEDVKQETRNGCTWITGNTRPIKEGLKAAGYKWSKKANAWYRRAA